MIYAVIDTNVIVSALLSHNPQAATVQVFGAIFEHKICPMYNDDIIEEYIEVLHRPKFRLPATMIEAVVNKIKEIGKSSNRIHSMEEFPDLDDAVFYEVALSKEEAYLVTGNIKHFPKSPIVVTPAEMLEIILHKQD